MSPARADPLDHLRPLGLRPEVVELQLVAKNDDWEARRAAFLSSYIVSGGFDPLFHEPGAETDAASVLEHRSSVIAWDRVPRPGIDSPRMSHLTSGRYLDDDMGGNSEIELHNIANDDIQRQVDRPPLRSVTIEMTATWQQDASVRSEVKWKHGRFLDPRPRAESSRALRAGEERPHVGARTLQADRLAAVAGAGPSPGARCCP